jgi:hypothetical protein
MCIDRAVTEKPSVAFRSQSEPVGESFRFILPLSDLPAYPQNAGSCQPAASNGETTIRTWTVQETLAPTWRSLFSVFRRPDVS